jgi:molybdopterin/thiamine biosynthesis adenylyltransferase
MNDERGPVAHVVEALSAHGFSYKKRISSGHLAFEGNLQALKRAHPCVLFLDTNFSKPPLIYLRSIPSELRPVAPHLSADGYLCYLSKGMVVLDIFDPVGQVIACLRQAQKVLEKLLRNEFVDDLEEEFFSFWGDSNWDCFTDVQDRSKQGLQGFVTEGNKTSAAAFITDNIERTKRKIDLMGHSVSRIGCPVFRIKTSAKPRPSLEKWPVKTLADLLVWQSVLERRCSRKILERVQQAVEAGKSAVIFMIDSPLYTYCFGVSFTSVTGKLPTVVQRRSKKFLMQASVTPMPTWRIDDRYMVQRNIPGSATLDAKRIVLIGCGTIGGYLADILVKSGAGQSGGRLLLIDNDSLQPSNLGRHRLGFPHVMQNKAVALAEELMRYSPGAEVKPLPVNAMVANFGKVDLLIDATGEEAFGHWLVKKYARDIPLLSVWIEGPGVAVRGLLQTDPTQGCYRCLTDQNRAGNYRSVEGEMEQIYAGQGCEQAYVPFPASVAMQAACLGGEMVLAWAKDRKASGLRTKILDLKYKSAGPDGFLPKAPGCPACSP